MCSVATGTSGRIFRIHKALLESKIKLSKLERSKVGDEELYTFGDTSDGTLVRFIEWAYREDYPDQISGFYLTDINVKPSASADEDTENETTELGTREEANNTMQAEVDEVTENNPLVSHLRMYGFAQVYGIEALGTMAFDRLTTCLEMIDVPREIMQQLAVVAALEIAFTTINRHDRLIEWLAHYASYCVEELRLQSTFHKLLEDVPILGSAMMRYMSPPLFAPWDFESEKINPPHTFKP